MHTGLRRTKIVATLGPASNTPELIRQLILAGMDVARLNFSHGTHQEHAARITIIRKLSTELATPITILQDLQGPKIRVGKLPETERTLAPGQCVSLLPEAEYKNQPDAIPIDYPHLAEEARPGQQVLLADGTLELEVIEVAGHAVRCRVVEGGLIKSRAGVNFPELALRLPSLTPKDLADLEFGLANDIDAVALSFVRTAEDVRALKDILRAKGIAIPIIAKIEKPQAIDQLDTIIAEADGVMVARGDLGVELSPERVPMLQKKIIEQCNRLSKPVITATQMLESMIKEPRPTRAEASDVANAIIDGSDAVMLSGETSVGAYPVKAVEMMDRIARQVEQTIEFKSYPPCARTETHALSEAVHVLEKIIQPRYIVVLTTSGYTATLVAAERPRAPVVALTTNPKVYHALNLLWGIKPLLVKRIEATFDGLIELAESTLHTRNLVHTGDKIIVLGGIPTNKRRGTNFIKVHTVS